MRRILLVLAVAAMMALMLATSAVPAFAQVGNRQAFCGEVGMPGSATTSPPGVFGHTISENAQEGSSIGEEIRGNASGCNEGVGPPPRI